MTWVYAAGLCVLAYGIWAARDIATRWVSRNANADAELHEAVAQLRDAAEQARIANKISDQLQKEYNRGVGAIHKRLEDLEANKPKQPADLPRHGASGMPWRAPR